MGGCCVSAEDTGRLFSIMSKWYRLKFRLFGFEKTQNQLLGGLRSADINGASLLDIGCGTGELHRALISSGVGSVLGVELSTGMSEQAVTLAREAGMQDVTDYRVGDFTAMAPDLDRADITVLDKVVCCYPDAEALMSHALDCTNRVIALTYPRDRRLTRAGLAVANLLLSLVGTSYRAWVHDPAAIEGWVTERGFRLDSRQFTLAWQTEIYVKG